MVMMIIDHPTLLNGNRIYCDIYINIEEIHKTFDMEIKYQNK